MEAADAGPRGRDEEVHRAIAVHVADLVRVEAERVARDPAGERLEQRAGPAGVQIRPAAARRGARVLPGADDEVGAPVAVDIAGDRLARSESFTRGCAGQREQMAA